MAAKRLWLLVAVGLAFPLHADVIEQELGTLYVGDSVPDSFVYLLLITKIQSMPQNEALAMVEDRIKMSATDSARFVEFAVGDAQRIETELNTTRLDMLCTPADSETTFQRLYALADLSENKAQESMILSHSVISSEAVIALHRYLDKRKSSTAYVRTDYRKTFNSLRIDVRNHVDEECAAGGRRSKQQLHNPTIGNVVSTCVACTGEREHWLVGRYR